MPVKVSQCCITLVEQFACRFDPVHPTVLILGPDSVSIVFCLDRKFRRQTLSHAKNRCSAFVLNYVCPSPQHMYSKTLLLLGGTFFFFFGPANLSNQQSEALTQCIFFLSHFTTRFISVIHSQTG